MIFTVNDSGEDDDLDYELAKQPHDAFFRQTFSNPAKAGALFLSHLPAEVSKVINFETMELINSSHVKVDLHQAHSDLLFKVRMEGDRELLLYLLFEHQTSNDEIMPLRLLAYQTAILMDHHKEHGLPLPPVLSLVLNQGKNKWKTSSRFLDLYDLDEKTKEAFGKYVVDFRHHLIDLTQIDPAKRENDAEIRAILQLMKLARLKKVTQFFEWLLQSTPEGAAWIDEGDLRKLLIYGMHSDSKLDVEGIANNFEGNKELKKKMLSTAEQLIAKGEARGKAEGEVRGQTYGKIQSLEEFLGKEPSPTAELSELESHELNLRYEQLHRQYRQKFKGE